MLVFGHMVSNSGDVGNHQNGINIQIKNVGGKSVSKSTDVSEKIQYRKHLMVIHYNKMMHIFKKII